MKYNSIFVVLMLIATTACSNCSDIDGSYTSAGGGEQITYLNLLQDNTFILKHEIWLPGAYDNRKITSTKGIWSCRQSEIKFKIEGSIYSADYLAIGKNPLGINEKTMVLHFKVNREHMNNYLNNETLYPASLILN